MLPPMAVEHAIELDLPPAGALSALRRTAEDWGAELQENATGGQLHLPVLAGLRRGLMSGPVEFEFEGKLSPAMLAEASVA